MTAVTARATSAFGALTERWRDLSARVSTATIWLLIGALLFWAAADQRQLLVVGVIVGSVLALGAIGLTLTYGILRFANFAHGDMMTLGAYVALAAYVSGDGIGPLSFGYGMVTAILAASAAVAALGVLVDRVVFRPLRARRSGLAIFAIASLGVALMVRAVVLLIWGPQPQLYEKGVQKAKELPFDVLIKPDQMFIIAVTLALIAGVYALLYRTKLGKAMRAVADNADLARVSGINTEQVYGWTWVIGGALVAVAGVLLGIQAQVTPDMGFSLLLSLFAATILGGIGSPHGALVGALVVGVSRETLIGLDLPYPPGWGAGYKDAVAFLVLIIMLILRPQGLFGVRR